MAFWSRKKVLVFGDSHTEALSQALQQYGQPARRITIETMYQKRPLKNGKSIGDTDLPDFLERIRLLGPDDMIVSMIAGNFHNAVGIVQHPVPFDFLMPGEDREPEDGVALVPYHVMEAFFRQNLEGQYRILRRFRRRSKACVCQLMAPPPKGDADFILNRPSTFHQMGIGEKGVSPRGLRLRLWQLQARVMEQLCSEYEVSLIQVPAVSQGEDGFLKPEYYAADATHANAAYGALLADQIKHLVKTRTGRKTSPDMGRPGRNAAQGETTERKKSA